MTTSKTRLENSVETMGEQLNLSDDVVEEGKEHIRTLHESDSLRGGFEDKYAVGILAAIAQEDNPAYTIHAISDLVGMDKNIVGRYKMRIMETLGVNAKPVHPKELVGNVVNTLSENGDVERGDELYHKCWEVFDILDDVDEGFVSGLSPSTLSGTVVWVSGLAIGEHISQKAVAEAANTTTVSIRNNCRNIFQLLNDNDVDPYIFADEDYYQTRYDNQVERIER